MRGLEQQLERLRELAAARERELDLLEHELAEIERCRPREAEHERLLGARERLRRLDALCAAAGAGSEALEREGSERRIAGRPTRRSCSARRSRSCRRSPGVDPALDALAERTCARSLIESRDLAGELRGYVERADGDGASGIDEADAPADARGARRAARRARAPGAQARRHASPRCSSSPSGRARAATSSPERRRRSRTRAPSSSRPQEELGVGTSRALRAARAAAASSFAKAVREQLAELAMADASFEVRLVRARRPGPPAATRSSS